MRYIYTGAAVLTGLAALAMSWWSIFSVGIYLGIPQILAGGLSSVFDLAALVLVGLSERYAETPHSGSGGGPRAALVLMLAGSIFLNVRHAQISGVGVTGMVAYAAPAIVAVLLVELHLRFNNRETRYNLGRTAPALPVIGGWAITLYPGKSLAVIRTVVRARLDDIVASVAPPLPVRAYAEMLDPIEAKQHADLMAGKKTLNQVRAEQQHSQGLVDLDKLAAQVAAAKAARAERERTEAEQAAERARAAFEGLAAEPMNIPQLDAAISALEAELEVAPAPSFPILGDPTPTHPGGVTTTPVTQFAPAHGSETANMYGVDAISQTGSFQVVRRDQL